MFSLPRDTVDVPIPPGPARAPVRDGLQRQDQQLVRRPFATAPTCSRARSKTRGYNGLKAILGNLYGLDIKYFVEVNFDGFRKVVDAIGGVTDQRPGPGLGRPLPGRPGQARGGSTSRAASSTWTAPQALRYARSRPRLERLRPRPAPAARPAVARASRPTRRHLIPQLPALDQGAQDRGHDRHPGQPAGAALGASRRRGRHQEHPVLRVHAAALPDEHVSTARAATSSCRNVQTDQARGQDARSRPTRRRGPAPEAGRRGGRRSGSSTPAGDRDAADQPGGLPRVPRAGRLAPRQKPAGAVRDHRRSWSTTVRRRHAEATIAYLEADVRGQGDRRRPIRPSGPTSWSPSASPRRISRPRSVPDARRAGCDRRAPSTVR